jgi:RNA recognition motif-containing protein
LREACSFWYYECGSGGGGGVKGPVSTRTLANLLPVVVGDDCDGNNGDDGAGRREDEKLDPNARVYPHTDGSTVEDDGGSGGGSADKWTRIRDQPHLLLAIEALTEVTSMPTTWPSGNNDDDGTNNVREFGAETTTMMTCEFDENDDAREEDDDVTQQRRIKDDLEAFLSSTDHLAPHASSGGGAAHDDDSDDEEYESDGGTRYVRDNRTGNWIHEKLAPKRDKRGGERKRDEQSSSSAIANTSAATTTAANNKRKRNKSKFTAKNSRNWIYVTGLPRDTNEEEVALYFSKVGILDLDPETQRPKVKLYRDTNPSGGGALKGDASICYARPESVELALQILDENLFRDDAILSVQRAKFEQHGTFGDNGKPGGRRVISEAKRKVARLAALQAVGWDEGENGRIAGGLKGLRIVVLMNMFDPAEFQNDVNDEKLQSLEKEVHAECDGIGVVEKITVFSKHPAGVMIVKFTQPNAASDAVTQLNGKVRSDGRKVEASYWDGVTDYTCRDIDREEKDTEKRLDEFGDWLEDQDLPEEFKLQVEE